MKWTYLTSALLSSVCGVLGASSVSSAAASTSTSTSNTPVINITGNAFWNSETGERFYIRGVDYQPGGSSNLTDPLADETTCLRDIEYFKDLGLNTIRVYTVDNSLSHDTCMNALNEAGIYLILDVNTPDASISRFDPACSYNTGYLQSVFATIDAFAGYDNVLGFFAGNEVINSQNTTNTATYVKATVRDMKKYLSARGYRQIPVGYSAADVSSNRLLAAEYFNCGNDSDARIDMFGVNDYSWCGDSSFTVSGYSEKVKMYTGYSLPIFLSEYGCNTVGTSRPFNEVETIYSEQMSGVFSGGLVYEYSNEDNNYGLVQISDDGLNVTELTDYKNFKAKLNETSNPSGDGGYSSSNSYNSCPTYEAGVWEADDTLPDMPSAASAYFTSGAGEPLGTGYDTQELCYDDSDYSESSSSTSSSTSSSSKASSSKSASSSSSASSASATASSSASSSSKSSGNLRNVPAFYNVIYNMSERSLVTIIVGFLIISVVAVVA